MSENTVVVSTAIVRRVICLVSENGVSGPKLSFTNNRYYDVDQVVEGEVTLDGIVTDLKKDLGISNSKDIHFLCLWLLDTKTVVVSEILGLNDNAVYIKRSRLKKSIMNLGNKYSFLFD